MTEVTVYERPKPGCPVAALSGCGHGATLVCDPSASLESSRMPLELLGGVRRHDL